MTTKDEPSMGQWARDIADTYSTLAAAETWPQRRSALATEAAKYYGIAARMDRIPRHEKGTS